VNKMGLAEAKVMLIFIGIILIVTNIFATNVPSLGELQDVSGNVIDDVYDIDSSSSNAGRLTGDGTKLDEWIGVSADEDIAADSGFFDFAFSSWTWVKNGIKMIWKFFYAPYYLVKEMTIQQAFLSWLPLLIGFIWTIALQQNQF